jgi:hypothetical protein
MLARDISDRPFMRSKVNESITVCHSHMARSSAIRCIDAFYPHETLCRWARPTWSNRVKESRKNRLPKAIEIYNVCGKTTDSPKDSMTRAIADSSSHGKMLNYGLLLNRTCPHIVSSVGGCCLRLKSLLSFAPDSDSLIRSDRPLFILSRSERPRTFLGFLKKEFHGSLQKRNCRETWFSNNCS